MHFRSFILVYTQVLYSSISSSPHYPLCSLSAAPLWPNIILIMSKQPHSERLTTLTHYLQNQLSKEQALQRYYQNKHNELKHQRNQLQDLDQWSSSFGNPSLMLSKEMKGEKG